MRGDAALLEPLDSEEVQLTKSSFSEMVLS